MKVEFPLRLGRGQNGSHGSWRVANARRQHERAMAGWYLRKEPRERPQTPCVVELTRIAPSRGLDDDNLAGSLKAVRDAFADWIGIDDRHRELVRYEYHNACGPWGVRIEVKPK